MKKLLSVLAILTVFAVHAQKNVFKVNVPAIAMGGAVVQYERDILPLINVQVGAGLYGRKDVNPFGLFNAVEALGVRAGGYALQAEVRIYPNILKDGPKGFYLAPYGKMGRYNLALQNSINASLPVDIGSSTVDVDAEMAFEMNGKMNFQAFGVQLGHQWLILKKVAINMYLMGPGVSFYDIDIDANIQYTLDATSTVNVGDVLNDAAAQDAAMQAYLDKLSKVPFIGKKLSSIDMGVAASENGGSGFSIEGFKLNYIPRMRMGLSVGIAL